MQIRCLVLYVSFPTHASYYDDWRDSFRGYPDFIVSEIDISRPGARTKVRQSMGGCDFIVMLHSCVGDGLDYAAALTSVLLDRRCRLIVFMANEFNIPWLPVSAKRNLLSSVRADIAVTQLPLETGQWLYEGCGAHVMSLPHALNPDIFKIRTPNAARPIDIGTRSFPYPIYLGDNRRNEILKAVNRAAARFGLRSDVRFDQRFDRFGWAAFLDRCRFTVATEAGTPYLERDDIRSQRIRAYLASKRKQFIIPPEYPGRKFIRRLPWKWREWFQRLALLVNATHESLEDNASLENDVFERFFKNSPPCPFPSTCISSRHFEAIGCGTVQMLVEGWYSGILEPDTHYIPIRSDLSNLEDVMSRLREPDYGSQIARNAFAYVLQHHTYRHRLDALKGLMSASA